MYTSIVDYRLDSNRYLIALAGITWTLGYLCLVGDALGKCKSSGHAANLLAASQTKSI